MSPVAAKGRQGTVRALAAAAALVLAGCGASGGGGASRSAPPTGFAVGTKFATFVDSTRPTEGRADVPAKPSRTLETFLYYPAEGKAGGDPVADAPALVARGPFPLVVFSHGSGVSSPVRYQLLLASWAAAGYVVAAPKHPLSSTSLPDSSEDVVNQPADVSFLITELTRAGSPYQGLIDGGRIAVAGHSLGAVSALGTAFNRCCVDARIRAGIALAGGEAFFPADGWFAGIRTPLLVVHGDDDKIVRIEEGREVFADAPPPKAMLTVFGGDHNRPYGGSLTTTDNAERLGATLNGPTRLVNLTVIAFLDRYVKGEAGAMARLEKALADEVTVKLEVVE